MRITESTRYAELQDFENYLSESTIEAIKAAAVKYYGSMMDLPFGTFYACAEGDFSHLGDLSDPTVLQVYWCKQFKEFVEQFAGQMKSLTIKQTDDERRASEGLLQLSWGESMLSFIQSYFGLHSFRDAERITMGEILLAKRAQYNESKYQRNLARIRMQRYNKR